MTVAVSIFCSQKEMCVYKINNVNYFISILDMATVDNQTDDNNNQLTTVDAKVSQRENSLSISPSLNNNISSVENMSATPSPQPTSSQVQAKPTDFKHGVNLTEEAYVIK